MWALCQLHRNQSIRCNLTISPLIYGNKKFIEIDFSSLIKLYEELKYTAAIQSKPTIFSSSLSDMITLVFVDFEIGVSYDMSHQFHKKQGWGLILAAHIFLTKNVSNLMPSYLCLSTVATDFSWQCFSHLGGLIFMSVPHKISNYHIH